jgi:hypothetical protein
MLDLISRARRNTQCCQIFEIPYPVRLSPDFHSLRGLREHAADVPRPLSIAKTLAVPAFFAKLPRQPAQNPVTRLWTACIRLKTNQIKACTFH